MDFQASLLGFSEQLCADHLLIYSGVLTREIRLGLGLAYLGVVIAYRHGSAPTEWKFWKLLIQTVLRNLDFLKSFFGTVHDSLDQPG